MYLVTSFSRDICGLIRIYLYIFSYLVLNFTQYR